jgi:hypothetical protein
LEITDTTGKPVDARVTIRQSPLRMQNGIAGMPTPAGGYGVIETSDTFGQLDASKPAQLRSFSRYFPSLVVGPAVADLEVGFELRHCEMFPFLGLLQERPALKGTEGRSLTVQRSYRAVSAHVLQDGFPLHL